MLAATRRWFRRNRTNLFIGAAVVGVGYWTGQYVLSKIQEARQRMSEERIAKDNLRRRFQQNQEDCTYTVLALLPTIREEIIGALPVEQITEQLQQERQERLKRSGLSEAASSELPSAPPSLADEDGKSMSSSSFVHASQMATSSMEGGPSPSKPKRSKAQLWQDMKIHSIARALTLIYTLSLLTLLTRIQLNLLGRRTYLSSVVALASPPAATAASTISLENHDDDNYDNVYGSDFETNRKYLTFSWWLLHRGSKQIMERVLAAVKDVFSGVNIREDMRLERLSDLIMQVRKNVEGSTDQERQSMRWLQYLLPNREDEAFVIRQSTGSESEDSLSPEGQAEDPLQTAGSEVLVNGALRRLLDETSDLIDSPTFSQILTRLLDAAYSHLVDNRIAVEAFKAPPPGPDAPRVVEVTEPTCKLANILPVFCKQAHVIAAGNGEIETLESVAAQDGLGNEYLAELDRVGDLEAFAAVIYSSNFEYEMAGQTEEQPAQTWQTQSAASSRQAEMQRIDPELERLATQATREVPEADPGAVADEMAGGSSFIAVSPDPASNSTIAASSGFEHVWKKSTGSTSES